MLFFLEKVCPFIVRLLCPTNRRRKELTMRIFPMPLSGEKRKWKKIGERCYYYCRVSSLAKEGKRKALLIDNFSRVPFSRGIRRENFVFASKRAEDGFLCSFLIKPKYFNPPPQNGHFSIGINRQFYS